MALLLVQAVLTLATVVHCASYKSQLRMGGPEWDDSLQLPAFHSEVHTHTVHTAMQTPIDMN